MSDEIGTVNPLLKLLIDLEQSCPYYLIDSDQKVADWIADQPELKAAGYTLSGAAVNQMLNEYYDIDD